MERYAVPVLAEIDTRALVRHLRTHGVMRGVISTDISDSEALVRKAKSIRKMDGTDLARVVSTKSNYTFDSSDNRNQDGDSLLPDALFQGEEARKRLLHVVAYDFGIKQNILRMLTREGCRVTVVPAETTASDVLALKPDGVFLSNGPGDPEPVDYAVKAIRDMMGRVPVFGICLGASALRIGAGRPHLQVEIRPSRRQPPGQKQHHRQSGDHRPQSQLRGRSGLINLSEVELTHVDLNDQDAGRVAAQDAAPVQRAISPRGGAGPA